MDILISGKIETISKATDVDIFIKKWNSFLIEENSKEFFMQQFGSMIKNSYSDDNLILIKLLEGLSSILENTNVEFLQLCGIPIRDKINHLNLQGTNVKKLDIYHGDIIAPIGCLNLKGTNVQYLELTENNIGQNIGDLNLQGTNVEKLKLVGNNIGKNIGDLNLQGTKVQYLELTQNNIGQNIGNLNLQGTNVQYLDLSGNDIEQKIGNLNLQGTNVEKLKLRCNNIASSIDNLNLQHTKVMELNLTANNLNSQAVHNLISKLAGTAVRKLNLSFNKFNAQELESLTFCNTNIESLDLSDNDLEDINFLDLRGSKVKELNLAENLLFIENINFSISNLALGEVTTLDISNNILLPKFLNKLDFKGTKVQHLILKDKSEFNFLRIFDLAKKNIGSNLLSIQVTDNPKSKHLALNKSLYAYNRHSKSIDKSNLNLQLICVKKIAENLHKYDEEELDLLNEQSLDLLKAFFIFEDPEGTNKLDDSTNKEALGERKRKISDTVVTENENKRRKINEL